MNETRTTRCCRKMTANRSRGVGAISGRSRLVSNLISVTSYLLRREWIGIKAHAAGGQVLANLGDRVLRDKQHVARHQSRIFR